MEKWVPFVQFLAKGVGSSVLCSVFCPGFVRKSTATMSAGLQQTGISDPGRELSPYHSGWLVSVLFILSAVWNVFLYFSKFNQMHVHFSAWHSGQVSSAGECACLLFFLRNTLKWIKHGPVFSLQPSQRVLTSLWRVFCFLLLLTEPMALLSCWLLLLWSWD